MLLKRVYYQNEQIKDVAEELKLNSPDAKKAKATLCGKTPPIF